MEDPMGIRRELSGKPAWTGKSSAKQRDRRPRGTQHQPVKTKQPPASQRASVAAQDWYDRGVAMGFDFPYDVNYFALALQRRVERDDRMRPLLNDGDKVDRWLAKMNANWWGTTDEDGHGGYVDGSVTARNAKEMFLGDDWEDIRDWAHSNLRKDYLLKHGRKVKPSINPNTSQAFRNRLEEIHTEAQVQRYIESQPEQGESPPLDETGRDRLRSFANRRRRRKK